MKHLILSLLLIVGFSATASTHNITGDAARSLMESLASAGFEVSGLDQEWSRIGVLSVSTGAFMCHYTVAFYPDEWMSGVNCKKGIRGDGKELSNPLALAQNIKTYAGAEAGAGNRWLTITDATCTLQYNTREYQCTITAPDSAE